MKINTRVFGEVDIEESKILTFPGGIVGFPDMEKFTLIYDEEKGNKSIKWMQSLDEPAFAMPVMDPLYVCDSYNPIVDDELLAPIGELSGDNMLVLVTVTIPKGNIEGMTVNLKGPIVINTETRKAIQVIADGDEYAVKYPVYEILKAKKEAAEKVGE